MATVTVREIAEVVRRPGESMSSVIDRIRNWTDEDLLSLASEKNPGTGKHRAYSENAVIEALILSVIKDAVGMQAVTSKPFVRLFREARTTLKRDLESAKGPGRRFFIMSRSRGGDEYELGTSWAYGLASYFVNSPHEAHVVVDLGKVEQKLASKGE